MTDAPALRGKLRSAAMIYCVVPEELSDELYEKMVAYYEDDPNVTVIIDRRKESRRSPGARAPEAEQRERRDRRRARVTGEFPAIEAVE